MSQVALSAAAPLEIGDAGKTAFALLWQCGREGNLHTATAVAGAVAEGLVLSQLQETSCISVARCSCAVWCSLQHWQVDVVADMNTSHPLIEHLPFGHHAAGH